ncbi:MAG: nucleoside deaminase [Coprobacillus sp.]|nr:nucleoside deaminase [Coprobacillus sp.]
MRPKSYEEKFMRLALKEALKGECQDEVPVGCLIVKDGKLISRAHNEKEKTNNPVGHAEILAIEKAARKLGYWRLTDCEMFVTLEPCMMCAGAISEARIKHLYFGALDPKRGAIISTINYLNSDATNHNIEITSEVLKEECENQISAYFKAKRVQN